MKSTERQFAEFLLDIALGRPSQARQDAQKKNEEKQKKEAKKGAAVNA